MANPSAKTFVQNALDDHFYTPDMAALYTAKWHPLFVYGTLKKGFSRHPILEDSIPLGPALTRGTGWAMFVTHHKHPFPVVFPVTSSLQNGKPSSIMTAYMYIGVLSHWRNDLAQEGMSVCDFYTRKKNPNYSYYAFTRKTINEALRHL